MGGDGSKKYSNGRTRLRSSSRPTKNCSPGRDLSFAPGLVHLPPGKIIVSGRLLGVRNRQLPTCQVRAPECQSVLVDYFFDCVLFHFSGVRENDELPEQAERKELHSQYD